MPLVDVPGERVDVGLRQVADERDAAAHVTVERGVAERDLGFVAARDEERARVVRLGHHQEPADARLQVLAREAARDRVGVGLEHLLDVVGEVLNRDDPVRHAERARQLARRSTVVVSVLNREGMLNAGDVFRAERVDGNRQGERRVDAAR